MNDIIKIDEPVGTLKMTQSYHENVSFLNPGDTLLLEEKHWKAGAFIAKALRTISVLPEMGDGKAKLVVEISGPSGAGKTELGYAVAANLGAAGFRCVCYSSDNCYKINPTERTRIRKEASDAGRLADVVGMDEYDWDLISRIESGILEGKTVEMPVADITKAERPIALKPIDFGQYDVLIFDGLYAVAGSSPVKVCIDQTWEGIMHAQRVRGKETADEHRMEILKCEMLAIQKLTQEVTGYVFNVDCDGQVTLNEKK